MAFDEAVRAATRPCPTFRTLTCSMVGRDALDTDEKKSCRAKRGGRLSRNRGRSRKAPKSSFSISCIPSIVNTTQLPRVRGQLLTLRKHTRSAQTRSSQRTLAQPPCLFALLACIRRRRGEGRGPSAPRPLWRQILDRFGLVALPHGRTATLAGAARSELRRWRGRHRHER